MKKFGFTLAEVLITLGIIGIVAAITIPVLMQNIQDYQFKQAWKKEYSVLNQATISYSQDNSTTFLGVQNYANVLKPYLKITQYCDTNASTQGCWVSSSQNYYLKKSNGTTIAGAPGNTSNKTLGGSNGLILSDGTLITTMDYWNATCDFGGSACGYILVDVNGFQKPNTIGKDVYGVWLLQNKVLPIGTSFVSRYQACGNGDGLDGDTGYGCSADYLYK